MKKLTFLLIIAIFAGFVSCKKIQEMFGGSSLSKEAAEEIMLKNLELQNKLREDSVMHLQEMNMLRDQYLREIEQMKKTPELQKGVKGYLVVVGSFKKMSNAEEFGAKIKAMGYEGALVEGPNKFTVVTSATYTNLKEAIEGYSIARNKLASDAWVYVKR